MYKKIERDEYVTIDKDLDKVKKSDKMHKVIKSYKNNILLLSEDLEYITIKKKDICYLSKDDSLDLEEAIGTIREYGDKHHCSSTGKYPCYQFNIKARGIFDYPSYCSDYLSEETIDSHIYAILDDYFSFFVGVNKQEMGVLENFSWINDFYVAGRSGGYLLLHGDDYDMASNQEVVEELDYLEGELRDMSKSPWSEAKQSRAREIKEEIKSYEEELKAVDADIKILAKDLIMIDSLIDSCKKSISECVSSDSTWEDLISQEKGDMLV